jgi:hypothetical protein
MTRLLLALALLLLTPHLVHAQGDIDILIEDLRIGLSQGGNTGENAAAEIERLARSMERPERLLPLVEQALASKHGTAEYGTVGCGYTALAVIAKRAQDPRSVLPLLEKTMFEHWDSDLREWVTSSLVEIARRAPDSSLELIEKAVNAKDSAVRDVALSAMAEAARGLPPLRGALFLDRILTVSQHRSVDGVAETVLHRLLVRAGRGADPAAYRELLDALVEQAKSEEVREQARERRVELIRRQTQARANPKADRWANYRTADGGLDWGKLFRSPFQKGDKGFAAPRPGAKGEVVKGFLPDVVASEVFKTVRDAGVAQAEAAGNTAGAQRLRGLQIQYLETNDIRAEVRGNKVRVSYGLLHEVYARSMRLMEAGQVSTGERGMYQARVLGLVFAHEVAHAGGIKAERVADARGVSLIWSSMLKPQNKAQAEVLLESTIALFDKPTGATAFTTLLHRIRSLFRYGTPAGRLAAMRRAANGQPDPMSRFRRADGTLKWKDLTKHHAKQETAGLMKFGLALFLNELAVVAQTGDKARIGEFFDGLLTTDFYQHYGLFVVGARAGEVAYGRYLQRYVKPRFVSGVLKTNLALATGMALPLIVGGQFEGQAFAISFASLGLSSAAVKAGMRLVRFATPLKEARSTGLVAKLGAKAGRLARLGGWLYTVGELAVVLYLADEIEGAVHGWLDARQARAELAAANVALVEAARAADATPESVGEAVQEAREAWIGYRDFLFQPLLIEEARLAQRMAKLARTAKVGQDERDAIERMLESQPALRAWAQKQLGSLEAYADARLARRDAALTEEVDGLLAAYEARRAKLLAAAYEDDRRPHALFADRDSEELAWLFGGSAAHGGGTFAKHGRRRSLAQLDDALRDDATGNRLQAYEDELRFFALLAAQLRGDGQDELAGAVLQARARAVLLHEADARLASGQGGIREVLEAAAGE